MFAAQKRCDLLVAVVVVALFGRTVGQSSLPTCADSNADGTTDDPFDCSSEANDIDTVPASITCSGDACTATECCTAVPPQVCSSQVQLNSDGQAQGNAAAGCDCVEPTTEAECLYAAVAACLNAGGAGWAFSGAYQTTGC